MTVPTPGLRLIRGEGAWSAKPVVAEIAVCSDGRCVLFWLGEHQSTAIYPSLRSLYEVHVRDHKSTSIVTEDRGTELAPHPFWPDDMVDAVEAEGRTTGLKRTGKPAPIVWCDLDAWGNVIAFGDPLEVTG